MADIKKFVIYYKPSEGTYDYTKSFTLSFSRINDKDNTFKKKVILEHLSKTRKRTETYKMKEIHIGANEILEKINKIDFEKKYTEPTKDSETYFIMYNDKKIATSNIDEIKDILDDFNFIKLLSITHKHYEYIKDMDEYTKLLDILNSKLSSLNSEQITVLSHTFKDVDPYNIFQSMGWLPKYLDDITHHS